MGTSAARFMSQRIAKRCAAAGAGPVLTGFGRGGCKCIANRCAPTPRLLLGRGLGCFAGQALRKKADPGEGRCICCWNGLDRLRSNCLRQPGLARRRGHTLAGVLSKALRSGVQCAARGERPRAIGPCGAGCRCHCSAVLSPNRRLCGAAVHMSGVHPLATLSVPNATVFARSRMQRRAVTIVIWALALAALWAPARGLEDARDPGDLTVLSLEAPFDRMAGAPCRPTQLSAHPRAWLARRVSGRLGDAVEESTRPRRQQHKRHRSAEVPNPRVCLCIDTPERTPLVAAAGRPPLHRPGGASRLSPGGAFHHDRRRVHPAPLPRLQALRVPPAAPRRGAPPARPAGREQRLGPQRAGVQPALPPGRRGCASTRARTRPLALRRRRSALFARAGRCPCRGTSSEARPRPIPPRQIATRPTHVCAADAAAPLSIPQTPGYDVFLGNVRANAYSRNHTKLGFLDPDFWAFTWWVLFPRERPAGAVLAVRRARRERRCWRARGARALACWHTCMRAGPAAAAARSAAPTRNPPPWPPRAVQNPGMTSRPRTCQPCSLMSWS